MNPSADFLFWGRDPAQFSTKSEGDAPIIVHDCTQRPMMTRELIYDCTGDIAGEATGNHRLIYDLDMTQLAQYGVSDARLGRFNPELLNNLSKGFGIDPVSSGWCTLTGASRKLSRGQLAEVSMEIEITELTVIEYTSPDGESAPVLVGDTGTAPTWVSTGPFALKIAEPVDFALSATGTATLGFSVKPGSALPAGLRLTTDGHLTGTPEGPVGSPTATLVVSNAFGADEKTFTFNVSAADAVDPTIEVYALYVVDTGNNALDDELWALGYYDFPVSPSGLADFLGQTPGGAVVETGGPMIEDPDLLTGKVGEGRAWEILEVMVRRADGSYEYVYQKSPGHTKLKTAIDSELDPITEYAGDIAPAGDQLGSGAEEQWPGEIAPSARFEQYFLIEDVEAGESWVEGVGGTFVYSDESDLVAKRPEFSLTYTESKSKIVREIYNVGSGYIYPAVPDTTIIDDLYTDGRSPIFYGGTKEGVVGKTSLPEEVPPFLEDDLPGSLPDPGEGPAPDATTVVYALYVLPDNGAHAVLAWQGSNAVRWVGTPDKHLVRPKIAADKGVFDEHCVGMKLLRELWVKVSGDWKCRYLAPDLTVSTSQIAACLANNRSPLNHPSIGTGPFAKPRYLRVGTGPWPPGW